MSFSRVAGAGAGACLAVAGLLYAGPHLRGMWRRLSTSTTLLSSLPSPSSSSSSSSSPDASNPVLDTVYVAPDAPAHDALVRHLQDLQVRVVHDLALPHAHEVSECPEGMSPQCCAAYIALRVFRSRRVLPRNLCMLHLVPKHGGTTAFPYFNLLALLHCPPAFRWVVDQCLHRIRAWGATVVVCFDKTMAFATPLAYAGGIRVACARIVDQHAKGYHVSQSTAISTNASFNSAATIAVDTSIIQPGDTVVVLHDVVCTGATKAALEELIQSCCIGRTRGQVHDLALIDCLHTSSADGSVGGLLAQVVVPTS